MVFLISSQILLLILLLINIILTQKTESLYYNVNPYCLYKNDKTLESSKNLLLEIMHGKLPFKIESSSKIKYDIDFIEAINGNIPCPYTLKSLELDEENNGIFLGAGINLMNFTPEEMNEILFSLPMMNFFERDIIKSYCQKKGKEAKNLIKTGNAIFNIRAFNKAVIDYVIEKKIKEDFSSIFNKELKTPFINGFLSMYLQFSKKNEDFPKNININSASYITKYLFEGAPFSRFIQSALISMVDGNGNVQYNNFHLLFVIPILFGNEELNNIQKLITSYLNYCNRGKNNNKARISILYFNSRNKLDQINYNQRRNRQLEDLYNKISKNETNNLDFNNIYEYSKNLFVKKAGKEYENKIIALFLDLNITQKYSDTINFVIDKYKREEGIQTIPFINKPEDIKSSDLIKYNLFCDFNQSFEIGQLKIAVGYMHIYIDLTNNKITNNEYNTHVEKTINNIKLNDIDSPLYIEVNINQEKNESVYYEISLDINDTQGYNIFISDYNPYPNIKNYTSKFIKYDNNLNPILRIKTNLMNKFYIGIEGILFFNLTIKKEYNTGHNELILSNGEYNETSYNISVYLKDETIKNLESFTSDYKPQSKLLKNDMPLDYILKYFARGIDLDNTDDGIFFNNNLFTYLFGNTYLINTIYRNAESNIYYMGRYIELNAYTPLKLKDEGMDQLLINKLYPFLKGNNLTLSEYNLPAISFNENELKLIYNITNRQYVYNIITLLDRKTNTINFTDYSPELKFVILCLYFQNSKENSDNIKLLGQQEPKYVEVIKNIKAKYKTPDKYSKFMINFLVNLAQEMKVEKISISLIVGQSFILSNEGIEFIKDFYNVLSKAPAKASLLVYDTLSHTIKAIIPFYCKIISDLGNINEYLEKNLDKRLMYNDTDGQIMDFEKIIDYGLSYFSRYDKGIKKELFIACDENMHTKDHYYVNNKLTNLKIDMNKYKELINNQINPIILSTKNADKGQIHELFTIDTESKEKQFTLDENYFHVNNFANTTNYINDLTRMAKGSIIKLNVGTRFINNFYQGKLNFYEINCNDLITDIIVIKANLSNFNFYYSFENPFSNPYMDTVADKTADDDTIIISNLEVNKTLYLSIESKIEIKKQVIEIFSCESYLSKKQYKNCKFVESPRFLFYILFLLIACFVIGLIVYNFAQFNDKNKMNMNIFEQ